MRSTNARVRGSLEGPAPEPLHALAFGAGLPAATTTLEEHWYVRDSVPARRGW